MVFYKFPSSKNLNRFNVSFWSLLISFLLSIIFFNTKIETTSTAMLILAALWGASFLALSIIQMYALSHVETNTLFPVTSILSLVLTVALGLTFFKDSITFLQGSGIFLVILTVYFYIFDGIKLKFSNSILGIGLFIVFLSALNKILQKLAADNVNVEAFQIYQYLFGVIFAFACFLYTQKETWRKDIFLGHKIGSIIGLFSFLGGYLLILALASGPLSLVFSIFALYTLVTAIAGYIFFKENLTKRKIALIFLAIVATLVIRLG